MAFTSAETPASEAQAMESVTTTWGVWFVGLEKAISFTNGIVYLVLAHLSLGKTR